MAAMFFVHWAIALCQTRGTGSLVIAAFLDFLTFALCTPYSETTDASDFDSILQMISDSGRVVFKLFQVDEHDAE